MSEPNAVAEVNVKEEKPAGPEPNVIYVNKDLEPPKAMNTGMLHIKLPAPAEQADVEEVEIDGKKKKTYKGKPFFHKDASLLVNTFPVLYKHFKAKG